MQMNKLLIVTTVPDTLCGFLLPFAHRFRALGWRVDAMAEAVSNCKQSLTAFDRVWDVQWSRQPLDLRNLLVAPQTIREVIVQQEYDIVHVHTPIAAFVTRYAVRDLIKKGKIKLIYTAHGFHFHAGGNRWKNALFLLLEKIAGRWTDYIVAINREDEEAAKHYRLLPPERVRYMPGIGVNLENYRPDLVPESKVMEVRKQLGLGSKTPLFLAIAEFIPRKRHQDILKAFARLTHPTACLALAGDGPLIEQMQKLALELGVQNRVHFLGCREDIPTLLSASIATVLVSEREGLPRSIMESLCLEIPVIGTDIRGIRDLLEKGCGLLVEVGDTQAICQAMEWILTHPEDAKSMGKRGREQMAAYDLQYILHLHESLYAEVKPEIFTQNDYNVIKANSVTIPPAATTPLKSKTFKGS
jgi:glycosyltransferase involved in cell wall biosynthesis